MDGRRGVHLFKLSHPPLTATPDQWSTSALQIKKVFDTAIVGKLEAQEKLP
jgi:hypothetical protein